MQRESLHHILPPPGDMAAAFATARRTPPPVPQEAVSATHIPQAVMHYLIQAGIQAPSGDNIQPWKFALRENTLSLYLDRQADQSLFNIQQLASILSCGAVLTNIGVAATACGLQATITRFPAPQEQPDLMASIAFTPRAEAVDPLIHAVWQRVTNRTWYAQRPLPPATLQTLKTCVAEVPGAALRLVTEATELRRVARLVAEADRIRTENRALHEHLYKMLRFTAQEALATGDGLPLKNLEAGLAGELFLKSSRPWWVMNLMNKLGLGRIVALHAYQALRHTSAAALLTVPDITPGDFLSGGEALQRLWLTLTSLGLAMQPMTVVTFFWLRWQLEGAQSFVPQHQALLRRVWQEYHALFTADSRLGKGHVMLFRIGYGGAIRHVTPRRTLESFVR